MEVIDEKGRLFGVVNVVDLLVVVFVLAVVAAGAALVLGGDSGPETETATITVRAEEVQPYVAEAIPAPGTVEDGNASRIESKSVEPAAVITTNASGAVLVRDHPTLKTVELTVTVEATQTESALVWNEKPLKIGTSVGLNLGPVDVRGNVTALGTGERNQ